MKEAILYRKIAANNVKCDVCSHKCLIKPGYRGICGTRKNIDGKLYSLIYGKIISQAIDPIEKKPLFHFLPGTFTYSYAACGCNLRCANCQNWQISQQSKLNKEIMGDDVSAQSIVDNAIISNCPSISATYTEPTIFLEFALDVMKIAKQKKLKNIWVSNGFMSEKTLQLIIPYLDAANIDLKFFSKESYKKYCGADLEPILANLISLKKSDIWVEVTTLIIPQISDQNSMLEKIAKFIYTKLGAETPWHISRFFPDVSYKLQNSNITPIDSLKKAKQIGKKIGLKNIYIGNV